MSAVRFLADEDLRYAVVLAVRRVDPRVAIETVHDRGLVGKSDDEVLAFASEQLCQVVSHDANTMTAAARRRMARGEPMPGLFIAHQGTSTRKVAEDLVLIAGASDAEEWNERIVYLPL